MSSGLLGFQTHGEHQSRRDMPLHAINLGGVGAVGREAGGAGCYGARDSKGSK